MGGQGVSRSNNHGPLTGILVPIQNAALPEDREMSMGVYAGDWHESRGLEGGTGIVEHCVPTV